MSIKRFWLLVAVLLTLPASLAAQEEDSYKFDIGAGIGMSGYLGEASNSIFYRPGVAANISLRYLASPRFAVRPIVSLLTLSGNTADWKDVLPEGKNFSFKATVIDLGVRAEFNFLPYGMGETYKRLKRWTPYLSLGVGGCLSLCDGNKAFGFTIPMGVGVKFKPSKRTNLAAEFNMTKSFSKKIDNIYDVKTIKTGFAKNTDWFSAITIAFSYEFGPRCVVCHRQD